MRERDDAGLARVISVGRNAAWIVFENETRMRLAAIRKHIDRLSLVPGDLVTATALTDDRVIIDTRHPRSFALERTSGSGRVKTMAANIDGIAIVAAFTRPVLHLAMIDELIAFAELHDLAARLILTKPDLVTGAEIAAVVDLYRGLGYATLVTNPKSGLGVEAIARELADHRTLLIGQSGVGKSSLFAALGGTAQIGDVSKIGRGKQTTTTGRLHRFPNGFLIDSPGVGEFELRGYGPREIAAAFRDFVAVGACRFSDCIHRNEPGCRVRAAIATGAIAKSRYAGYCEILDRET